MTIRRFNPKRDWHCAIEHTGKRLFGAIVIKGSAEGHADNHRYHRGWCHFTFPAHHTNCVVVRSRVEDWLTVEFRASVIDDDPVLMEQGFRLRYQVYCVERGFLRAEDYPDKLEHDAFDAASIHVGAVDAEGALAGTARLIKPNSAGYPLFRHCALFPNVTALDEVGNLIVEVSRVSISRHYARRRDDPPFGECAESDLETHASMAAMAERRRRRSEPFLTLLKAIVFGAKRVGATHLLGATDPALHRWLVHFGFPYRLAGPEVDYYGRVSPYLMSLCELDQVVLSGAFVALQGFPVGTDPARWRSMDEYDGHIARTRSKAS
jgi:N-acyl amino acid synthase of PEP-CTERM/exosortase system